MHPLAEKLEGLIPAERFRVIKYDPLMRLGAGRKGLPIPKSLLKGEPCTVVDIESAEELSHILRTGYREDIPIYVRQGTGNLTLEIIRPEPPGSFLVDMRRMRWMKPAFEAGYIEVGPAVTIAELNRYLAPYGYSYPAAVPAVTWGGIVSINASGQLVDPVHGKPGDLVLGLQVVLPQGDILETGTRSLRKVSGFDISNLFIGNQGLFGVITGLRLRLVRSPRERSWGIAEFGSVVDMAKAVTAVHTKGNPYPRFFESVDRQVLKLISNMQNPPGAMIYIETDGDAPGESPWKMKEVLKTLEEAGAQRTQLLTKTAWEKLLKARQSPGIQRACNERNLVTLFGEVFDPPLPEFVNGVRAAKELQDNYAKRYPGLYPMMPSHIGGATTHIGFVAPKEWGYERLVEVTRDVRKAVIDLKISFGATTGEQGIHPGHSEWFRRYYGEKHVELLHQLKSTLDPKWLLNSRRLTRES